MTDPGPGQAVEVGAAYLSIIGETDKLGRAIKDQLKQSQAHARANPISVKATANVELRSTAAERNTFVAELNRRLKDRRILVYLTPVIDEQALRNRLNNMPEGRIKLGLDVSAAEMNRFITDLRRRLRDADFTVPVRMDLSNEAAFRARMEDLTRSRTVDVDVNADSRGLDRLKSAASFGGLTKGALGLSAASAGIAAIGGAAGAALGAISTLGVGIAALGPAAAAAGATAAVGLQGIGDAFKALSAAEDSAGSDGAAQAKAVAAAQEQVQTALEGVETAQRNLADAQKDAHDAQSNLAQAYKDAADELEDYQFKLKDAALSEKEAALAVKEARDELAKAKPEDRAKAALRLERAELRYAEAVEKNKDTQEAAADAQAKGIEGSDKVVAAKDRVAQADQKVADAQTAVTKANEQVAKAQQAVADAADSSSSSQDKAAQALAKLSPNAQAFVLATRDLAPAWKDLRGAVQDSLFDGAAQGITELATAALPTLKAGMVDVAGSMNGLTKQFAAFWAAPQNLAGIQSIFAGTKSFIDGLGPGLQQATTGFLSLGQAFEPVANQVGAQFAGMLGQIGQSFTDAFANGSLTQLISTFGDTLQGLGEGLNPLIDGLIQIGNIVGPTLGPLFKALGESIGALAPSLGQIGATFATTLTALMPDLTKFIDALLTGLQPVLPVIGDLLRSVMTALTPLIGPMSQIAQVVGTALAQAITALAPAIGPLGDAFASLVAAVAPILPVLAQVIAGLVQALAPALTTIFNALGPVIKQWADLMLPVFEQLQPILADVAKKIADALVSALNQLAPYLPDIAKSFGDLITAIAPLLPQLIDIGVSLLPPMLDLFIAILPQLLKLIDAFTWLVNNVIEPLVIPALKMMADNFGSQLQFAADAVTTARDVIGGAVDKIGEFFTDVGATIGAAWDGVVHGIAVAVKKIGELLQQVKIPDWVPGVGGKGAGSLGDSLVKWADAHMATGGLLRGKGTGTSDSMLIAASTGEFVVNAAATSKTLPLLQAINSGWVPSADFLHGMVPGFRDGGPVPGKDFAVSMDSATYLMGGFNRSQIDCSGIVSAVVNDALGLDPFAGRMSTVNEGKWLADKGALPGLGGPGDISISWFDRGGGANGHTALTLGDGTNVESNGSEGVVIGGKVGAGDAMFDQHAHIPASLLRGGDLGGPATGAGAGSTGRPGKLGGSTGGAGGSGTSGGSGGSSSGGSGGSAAATNVFVTNWPTSLGVSSSGTGNSITSATPEALSSNEFGSTPTPLAASSGADQSTHPLANLPIPGASELFNGPAPWYMAATPEQALSNLGTQAASLAQSGADDVTKFFQNNWKELLNSGLAVAGIGATGGGGTTVNNEWNISGTDPMVAAIAVERQQRRRTLATQRSGGFGR
ncbi:hypothetical protein ACQPXH_19235 [Nocardia sp. CA-135953]|uniref:hypothetical protein n=1 Tax=Nocardia sp. CA-135953 TaxID=3239978 RepID=UPI003D952E91